MMEDETKQIPCVVVQIEGPLHDKMNTGEENSTEAENDPWAISLKETDDGPVWRDMSCGNKVDYIFRFTLKIVFILAFLYLFICALGFLGDAFQLVGGKTAGKVFRENHILSNPVAGLMIGVLVTVLLQSSSTTTSIIITMVGSEIIPIKTSIPMLMGANIGTSVTNTIVSLAESADREEFRKAFGGATVHDMFNWLSVIILLPLEYSVHYLYHLTHAIVNSMHFSESEKQKDMLKVITKPFTGLIVKINKDVIKDIASNTEGAEDCTVLHRWCKTKVVTVNGTVRHLEHFNQTLIGQLKDTGTNYTIQTFEDGNSSISWNSTEAFNRTENVERCPNLFAKTDLSDETIGILLLVISLVLIVVSLIFMVKMLNSLLKGSMARVVKKFINSDLPGPFKYLTGYLAIMFGAGMTIIVQSSSVFTSTLTPLVGVGVVSIERMFPLTIGSNIGTCVTGILAALANPAYAIPNALQVSLCHLFFNLSGAILFYPIPITRKAPINLAKGLGNITAKYRWFSILYLIVMFIGLPGFIFGLSLSGEIPFAVVGSIILFIVTFIVVINILQRKCTQCLPKYLRNWNFLPLCCHSLKSLDRIITKILSLFSCRRTKKHNDVPDNGHENTTFTRL